MRWLAAGVLCLGVAALLGGCHHRPVVPTLPPVVKTPDVAPTPPAKPKMEEPPPKSVTVAPPVKVTKVAPKRPRKKSGTKAVQEAATKASPAVTPAEPAGPVVTPPVQPVSAVGELSARGDAEPKTLQEVGELIASIERRVNALPQETGAQQQTSVRSIRLFLTQARQALGTTDTQGARTLATKAQLLLDDLTK